MRGLRYILTTAALVAAVALAGGAAQAAKFKVLYSFCESNHRVCGDGSNPSGGLVMDAAGNFYGAASTGGLDAGTVYELERKPGGGFKFKTIYRFCTQLTCGYNPSGALVIDTSGNLYGTATNLIFELSPGGKKGQWIEKVLHRFCSDGCGDGNDAVGGLTYAGASTGAPYDGVSPLYGVTNLGGAHGKGVVFSLKGGDWIESVLYDFCSAGGKCLDGAEPAAGLIMDAEGNLFGTTAEGGGNDVAKEGAGTGLVFELSQNGGSWTESVLYRFCGQPLCADGAFPDGELVIDETGALIGTTRTGGNVCKFSKTYGCGTLFKLTPNGSGYVESILYAFCAERDCRDGWGPTHALQLIDGNIVGTTQFGGANDIDRFGVGGGTVHRFSASGLQTLHRFCSSPGCSDGEYPQAGLTESNGYFLSSTSSGGDFAGGTIFRLEGK